MNISFDEIEQKNKIEDILTLDEKEWRVKYNRMKDAQSWKYIWAKQDAAKNKHLPIIPVSYKPFDIRYSLYTGNSGGLYARPVNEVMQHLFLKENYALVVSRQCVSNWRYIFISNLIGDFNLTGTAGRFGSGYFMPLYLYNQDSLTQSKLLNSDSKYQETPVRTPNLDPEIVADIAKGIGLTFTNEKEEIAGTFAPIDILDYIYAVLHSPTYRETYKEFLKIDFPRVPYPSDVDIFWQLVALGGELRRIHLLESPKLAAQTKALGIGYPVGGDNAVTRKMTKTSVGFEPDEVDSSIGKVWLNDTQYFTNVPLIAWEFYIGGYQPAQKWLKDRQGRTLDHSDIKHYMNIIAALSLTNELMQQIDDINVVG